MTRLCGVLLAGIAYLVIGLGFSALARQGGTSWRFAAWAISAAVFATHIGYEHVRLRSTPRITAWYAALAVALGGFGLAAAATVHALASSSFRVAYVIALAAWPMLLGVPAFLVALAAAAGLAYARSAQQR